MPPPPYLSYIWQEDYLNISGVNRKAKRHVEAPLFYFRWLGGVHGVGGGVRVGVCDGVERGSHL